MGNCCSSKAAAAVNEGGGAPPQPQHGTVSLDQVELNLAEAKNRRPIQSSSADISRIESQLRENERGVVLFDASPWSNGHQLLDFIWTGEITETGDLYFHFEVSSALFSDSKEKPTISKLSKSDWEMPSTWLQHDKGFHISTSGARGILAGNLQSPCDLMEPLRFNVAPSPPTFGCLLFGPAGVGPQEIQLFPKYENINIFLVSWHGQLAIKDADGKLTKREFDIRARASLRSIKFPQSVKSESRARALLSKFVKQPQLFDIKLASAEQDEEEEEEAGLSSTTQSGYVATWTQNRSRV